MTGPLISGPYSDKCGQWRCGDDSSLINLIFFCVLSGQGLIVWSRRTIVHKGQFFIHVNDYRVGFVFHTIFQLLELLIFRIGGLLCPIFVQLVIGF